IWFEEIAARLPRIAGQRFVARTVAECRKAQVAPYVFIDRSRARTLRGDEKYLAAAVLSESRRQPVSLLEHRQREVAHRSHHSGACERDDGQFSLRRQFVDNLGEIELVPDAFVGIGLEIPFQLAP